MKPEARTERTDRAEPAKDRADTRERAEQKERPDTRDRQASAVSERSHRWEKKAKAEETFDDIHRDNERIEKEIWLEIASIHNIKLDF